MGVRKVMAIINNPAYVDLMQGGAIDIAISPQLATLSVLLTHVRRGDVVNVHSLRRGAAEAIEAIAHGDAKSSKVVGRKIRNIHLPPGAAIAALIRNEEVIMVDKNTEIASGDHVILFVVDKKHIPAVERLFQVGLSFL
jgi:trk system potassium uptake protein TrkA